MQILTFSSLYPNEVDPSHGIFVERRLRELINRAGIRSTVISPVPWFPFKAGVFGRYAALAAIQTHERRFGIDILHPRYPLIPKFGMNIAARLMSIACEQAVKACVRDTGAGLIDAHYFYPDGVAASSLARRLGLPYCITARGSDINLISRYTAPRKQMLRAAEGAAALIAVSDALATSMADLGMPADKIHVLRNGVDLDFFSPEFEHATDGSPSPGQLTFLSIGALKKAKGHDIAIRFLSGLEDARLVIIGTGAEEAMLRQLAAQSGVSDRVIFTGRLEPGELREWYIKADAVILMSEREGMPNVILESLACGTPVLATAVGGIPEILTDPVCGRLVSQGSAGALHDAWRDLSMQRADRPAIRQFATRLSWKDTIGRLHRLMMRIAS